MAKIFLALLLSSHVSAANLFVAGESHLSLWDGQTLTSQKTSAQSWEFDAKRCRVWSHDAGARQIQSWERTLTANAPLPSGPLVSPYAAEQFLTWNSEHTKLLVRNSEGAVQSEHDGAWAKTLKGIVHTTTHSWAMQLDEEKNKLSVVQLDKNYQPLFETKIPAGRDLFPSYKILTDSVSQLFYVGYSATTAKHAYGPHVTQLSEEGKALRTTTWPEKGLFLDMCTQSGMLYVSREEPSTSGWTVPISSHFEKIAPDGRATKVFTGETNYFMDRIACTDGGLYFIERSIYPSGTPYLSYWNEAVGTAQRLTPLPERGERVFLCD